jgi:hypothetical protein
MYQPFVSILPGSKIAYRAFLPDFLYDVELGILGLN